MRARAFSVGAVVAVAIMGTAGCSRTEMIVAIAATELAVPTEIDRIAITVTNPQLDPEGKNPVFVSPQTALCATGQAPDATCTALPSTLTLYPGESRPNETVRVQLDALLQGRVVLSQASIFSFAKGKSGRLTFDLYRDCLQLACATVDQACAQGGVCRNLSPVVESRGAGADLGPSSIALVSASSGPVVNDAPGFDVAIPSDAVADDHLLVAFTGVFGGNASVAAPGWKQLTWLSYETTGEPQLWLFERIVSVSEPPKHTFTINSEGSFLHATYHLLHHRGVRSVEGVRAQPGGGTPTIPSVNVQGSGRVLLALVQRRNMDFADCPVPTGLQRILNGAVIVYSTGVGPGMTGDRTFSCTPPGAYGVVALALVP